MTEPGPQPCATIRASLSARLDGEESPVDAALVHRHLEVCATCATFAEELPAVARQLRVATAAEVPDLTAGILASLPTPQERPRRVSTVQLRLLVALTGVVQVALAIPVLAGALGPGLHHGRELGALQIAVGIALLLAAWDPVRSAGVLPVIVVVAGATVLIAVVDVAGGRAAVTAELAHLSELVGLVALWGLHRRTPQPGVRRWPWPAGATAAWS